MLNRRPEHEILLCVARRELDAERARLRELLSWVGDWEYLLAAASYHGLVPLLHKHVHASCHDLVPVNVLSRLKQSSLANTQNVLHLLSKQLKVVRLLKESGVRVAVLKGSVLSQMAYGEISLRQAGDIDLLIGLLDFARTRALLESLGYEMTPQLTTTQLDSHLKHHCEIQFVRDDWFTVIDLHWELAPKSFVFNLEADEVMSRLQRVTVAGAEIQTLATVDLILYLSMHGAKHLWRALEWISALGELIRTTEAIDWDVVVERAVQSHATRMLGLALRLVERVSGPGIVSQALDAMHRSGS
ncbi:MAG TPA: nucleotidyltransferase family protein, partial [Pyrinomonadaceae bacterium]